MLRVAVTGANGFVGRAVVAEIGRRGGTAIAIVRSDAAAAVVAEQGGRAEIVPDHTASALAPPFDGAAAVVHLAGIGRERGDASFDQVNVGVTRSVVAAARDAGVPRVVHFSGLGVARYGRARRVTDRYFLSKLLGEAVVLGSGLDAVVLRPSYIVGPGGELLHAIAGELERRRVEVIDGGDGRLQPIAVADAASVAVAAAAAREPWPMVLDLVGPEPVSYVGLVERVARACGAPDGWQVDSIPAAEADRRAAAGGYRGMGPEELNCLLCDEVGDPGPLEALLGRPLQPLAAAVAAALRPARPS